MDSKSREFSGVLSPYEQARHDKEIIEAKKHAAKLRFIEALAEVLTDRAAMKSIKIEMGDPLAAEWAKLKSATPVRGYATKQEALATLLEFLK